MIFFIFIELFLHVGTCRLKRVEKEGSKNDVEATTQSNGGFQVSSLMGQMSKKVKSLDNRSNVELPKGVKTAKRCESLSLEDMPTPERPARARGRQADGPVAPSASEEADVALLGQSPTKPSSPNERAPAEFFKDLQSENNQTTS